MTRKKWPVGLPKKVFDKNNGKCWHCNKKIYLNRRTHKDGRGAWHIDHYPVPFRDIENQILIGITDQHDIRNLVPACIECNLSHNFEVPKWYYCNHSQIPCRKYYFHVCYIIILNLMLVIFILSTGLFFITEHDCIINYYSNN